ncbi:hypothetical protein VNO77_25977 [Canavalia gladiata]|uniref:Uncharacterized protein n=1 Tax=Canavalia gladiata TaxID=3824 RepID=A0AAN9KSF1_CANGL
MYLSHTGGGERCLISKSLELSYKNSQEEQKRGKMHGCKESRFVNLRGGEPCPKESLAFGDQLFFLLAAGSF